ncbi:MULTISPECIES: nuclear transport factor 2 family protein [unclassified Streptomyces]|uniref:nuclear transport factor 2 family protein n=1 Tax=unclassified Streptomyces TaxID=2593676 RepID=UPI000C280C94|nr:hypothetical protein [Streptomyces sp. CB02959]PJN34494.1 hypothetical protein CG747_39815 [Streptomyces sp. CB02959]
MSAEEKNKELVREAFDTLFNQRDYAAAERFWSPDYIQHSAHIPPGREGGRRTDPRRRWARPLIRPTQPTGRTGTTST